MWKDFFYFSRTERQGIIILAVLIVLVCSSFWFIPDRDIPEHNNDQEFEKEYADFIASLKEQDHLNQYKQRYFKEKKEIILASFDPNTADSITFINMGIPSWMAHNILRYRIKGGKFRKAEDFRKIYGLTEEQYAILQPYITINESFAKRDTVRLLTHQTPQDTIQFYKYAVGTMINLNNADTTELKKIPGIGSAIAHKIVKYRKQLGGFYRVEQLQDINLSVDKLSPWFTVNANETQRINLNKASIERLKSHPYINFYQAKVIVEYRKKKGNLKSLEQLKLYDEFSGKDIEKLSPYVCF